MKTTVKCTKIVAGVYVDKFVSKKVTLEQPPLLDPTLGLNRDFSLPLIPGTQTKGLEQLFDSFDGSRPFHFEAGELYDIVIQPH